MKSIIFDMDGVIIDSEYDHAVADINALKRFGVTVDMDYIYRFVGTTITHMTETIIRENHMSVPPKVLIDAFQEEKEKITLSSGYRPVEGTVELIHKLKKRGHKLAIASSSTPVEIQNVTNYFHITDCFDTIVSGSYVKRPKPAPDIFLHAVRLLEETPDNCFVIEDSTVGVAAARTAGIETIGFVNPNSGNQNLEQANHIVLHMKDCLPILTC